MSEFKPGDVATMTTSADTTLRIFCYRDLGTGELEWMSDDEGGAYPSNLRPARPLVVIDVEDRDQMVRLRKVLSDSGAFTGLAKGNIAAMQAALRSLIEPPKPEEPTGLGAVVESHSGHHYIRHGNGPAAWMLAGASPGNRDTYPYSQVDAVRVLSEGVTP